MKERMAKVSDVSTLCKSAVLVSTRSLDVNSPKVIEWKCVVEEWITPPCGGVWKESVVKRAKFTMCPECQPAAGRSAKVTKVVKSKFFTPLCTKTNVPKDDQQMEVVCESMETLTMDDPNGVDMQVEKNTAFPACSMCRKAVIKIVKCDLCTHAGCVDCMKRYILSGISVARCSNEGAGRCGVPFTTKFLLLSFGKEWIISKYFPFLHRITIAKERAMIPATLNLVKLLREQAHLARQLGNVCNAVRQCKDDDVPVPYDVKESKDMLNMKFNMSLEWANAYPHDQPAHIQTDVKANSPKPCPMCGEQVSEPCESGELLIAVCTMCFVPFEWNSKRMDAPITTNPYHTLDEHPTSPKMHTKHMIDNILCMSVGREACELFNRVHSVHNVLPSVLFEHRHSNGLYRLRADYLLGKSSEKEWLHLAEIAHDELAFDRIETNINEVMCKSLKSRCDVFINFLVDHQDDVVGVQLEYTRFMADVNGVREKYNALKRSEHAFSKRKPRMIGDEWYLV